MGVEWVSVTGDGITTYLMAPNSTQRATELHRRDRDAVEHALRILGEPRHTARVRVFYVPSRAAMQRLMGSRATGITEATSQTVILVQNDSWAPFTRHEIMHAVSLRLWDEPGHTLGSVEEGSGLWLRGGWLREGVAAYAENRCGTYSNRDVAAALLDAGDLIDLTDLFESFYSQPDFASYLQAGALVEFLLVRFGRARLRALWDTLSVEETLGVTPSELQQAWTEWLKARSAEGPVLEELKQRGCG